jgi:TRAP-type transport system periplasmic protein
LLYKYYIAKNEEDMMKKQFLALPVVLLVLSLILAGCSSTPTTSTTVSAPTTTTSAAAPITLTFASDQPETHILEVTMANWMKSIDAATNGRLKFKTFFSGSLIPADQSWAELKKGTADLARVSGQLIPASFPMTQGAQKMFYGCKSLENNYRIYHQLQVDIPEFAKEWSGAKILVDHDPGEQQLQSNKPVRSLADLKGYKVRTAGPWLKDTFTTLGASVITVPPTEIYVSLQKSIIDGDVHPMEFLKSFKTAELEKYTTTLKIYDCAASRYCMNWDSYNKLPADLQKVIDNSLPKLEKDIMAAINSANNGGLDFALSLGPHEVIDLPAADLAQFYSLAELEAQKAAKDLDAKGLPGSKLFELARQYIKAQ